MKSKFFSPKLNQLQAYVPGEQPQDRSYVKLNTNESPFPPSPYAQRLARQAAGSLNLYCDPDCGVLASVAAEYFGVEKDNMIFTNGSDEVLNFAFLAFCDQKTPAVFPDVTYGFYSVFAKVNGVPCRKIPLDKGLRIRVADYFNARGTIFIANPNAPTGIALAPSEIRSILENNKDNIVVVDEAYVDFGGDSVLPLINRYSNLLVTRTFSKSYSLAGARLGIGFASKKIIADLKRIKYSTNPYNVNSMTAAAGVGALLDKEYFEKNVNTICFNRDYLMASLDQLGFKVLPSSTNFVFAKKWGISGKDLYISLKRKGVLVRYFNHRRLVNYVRITVGTGEQIDALLEAIRKTLEEKL